MMLHMHDKVYYWYMDNTMRSPVLLRGTIVGCDERDTSRGMLYRVKNKCPIYEDLYLFEDELYKTLDDPRLNTRNFLVEGQ